jgi:hypothetical protein
MRNAQKKPEIPALFLPAVETPIERITVVGNSVGKTDKTCSKCGKYCERGLFTHMKYCKGK